MLKIGREVLKRQGREFVKVMREEAPQDTGTFAKGFRYRTRQLKSGEFGMTIFAAGPHAFLMPMIVYGTKAHEIPTGGAAAQKAKGYPLKFFWQKGPNGPGIYRFWRVWHPGTKPNNFVRRTITRQRGPMRRELRGYFWSSVIKVA